MATPNRDHTLRVRMTEEERRMLEELATRRGLTASDVVRLAVRREHEEQGQAEPPKRRKR